jgi:hypothetical protein
LKKKKSKVKELKSEFAYMQELVHNLKVSVRLYVILAGYTQIDADTILETIIRESKV